MVFAFVLCAVGHISACVFWFWSCEIEPSLYVDENCVVVWAGFGLATMVLEGPNTVHIWKTMFELLVVVVVFCAV